eukprot:8995828-Pyramimonas_sp.AAC.1
MFLAATVFLAHFKPPAPFIMEARPTEPGALTRTKGPRAIDLDWAFSTVNCGGEPPGQRTIVVLLCHPAEGGAAENRRSL